MSKRCDKGSKAFAKVTIIRIEGKRGGKKREESRQNFNFDALKAGSKFPEESPDAGLPRLSRANDSARWQPRCRAKSVGQRYSSYASTQESCPREREREREEEQAGALRETTVKPRPGGKAQDSRTLRALTTAERPG